MNKVTNIMGVVLFLFGLYHIHENGSGLWELFPVTICSALFIYVKNNSAKELIKGIFQNNKIK